MQHLIFSTATHRFALAIALTVATIFNTFAQGCLIIPKYILQDRLIGAQLKAAIAENKLFVGCGVAPKADLKKYLDHLTAANAIRNGGGNVVVIDYTVIHIINAGNNEVLSSRHDFSMQNNVTCTTITGATATLQTAFGTLAIDGTSFSLQKIAENVFCGSVKTAQGTKIVNCTIRRGNFYIEAGTTFID